MSEKKKKKSEVLRIAMLGHKRIPSREGGVEIVVYELCKRMAARGHDVTCYNRRGNHVSGAEHTKPPKKSEYKKIKIKTVFTIDKRGIAAMTSSLSASIRAAFGKYDIVHYHAEGPCAMLWIPKLFGKKCVATIHGLDHMRDKWGTFASWYIKMGEKCAVKFADEIIVLSENNQKYFRDTYGRETIFIPNGVKHHHRHDPDETYKAYGLEKQEYILFLARLVPEKGVEWLIEAFKKVKTDKKLVIAGGSSDTADFEARLKKMAKDDSRIIFTGFVEGQKLKELYSNAYFYVLPSRVEGMPLSLLEAMSYGNCCLTSDIPECADVIEDKGLTFETGNVEELRKKLQMLCDDPETVEAYKSTAEEYICDKYNWDDVTKMTLDIYANVRNKK